MAQMQEFLTAWINWYYGDDKYPQRLQDGLTWAQKLEAISKTEQIKQIIGKSAKNEY
jgi:hypothetical protein